MANVGYATLSVIPSFRGAAAALEGGIAAPAASAGLSAGGFFSTSFGKQIKALLPALTVGAIGAAAIGIGTAFDDAFDAIQTGTGATGDALEDLKDVFRDVVADVPTDFASAADAISLVNQRLELTGRPLEVLSEQFLELSRITETDLTGNIDSVTRAFGDWSVATEDQSEVLDRFFRASQDSGVAVSELAEGVVQFGSPLRQLGFSLDESIALFASFGEAGVNTSTVMSGMRQAVKNFASGLAENELGVRNFGDVLNGVRDGTFDLSDAMTLFGARAGADMFAAIQEGRFDLEDFLGAMRDTEGGIMETAESTRDFGESFEIVKNNIMLLLEGPASALMGWVSSVAGGFANLVQTLQGQGVGAAIQQLRDNFGGLSPLMQGVVIALGVIGAALALFAIKAAIAALAFLAIPIAIALVAAGLVYAYQRFEGFRNVVDAVVQYLAGIDWAGIWDALVSAVQAAIEWIVGTAWPAIVEFAGVVRDAFASVDWAGVWATIVDAVTTAFNTIQTVVTGVIAVVQALWATFGDTLVSLATTAWGLISGIIQNAVNIILGIWNVFAGVFTGDWSRVWDGITQVVSAVWDQMISLVQSAWQALIAAVRLGLDGIRALWDAGWEAVKSVLRAAWEGIKSAVQSGISAVVSFLTALPGRAVSAVAAIVSGLTNKGREAMQGMFEAIQTVWGNIRGWLSDLPGRAASAVGNMASALIEKGRALIQGLWDGARAVWNDFTAWLGSLNPLDYLPSFDIPFIESAVTVGGGLSTTGPVLLDGAISARYSGESAQTRIVVDANGVDSALVEWLRRSVRVESGGNVQAYLGA